jgi:hypothetical protein
MSTRLRGSTIPLFVEEAIEYWGEEPMPGALMDLLDNAEEPTGEQVVFVGWKESGDPHIGPPQVYDGYEHLGTVMEAFPVVRSLQDPLRLYELHWSGIAPVEEQV